MIHANTVTPHMMRGLLRMQRVLLKNRSRITCGMTACFLLVLLTACAPAIAPKGTVPSTPALVNGQFTTHDGLTLPVRQWAPETPPDAIVLALHGYTDYSHFTEGLATHLAGEGIQVYAPDQRGFGQAPHRGLWPGHEVMQQDAHDLLKVLQSRHSGTPVFLLGESMGGAVAITTLTRFDDLDPAGVILMAPAIWGPATWPWYQRAALYATAYTVPWLPVSGQGLQVTITDNTPLLREMAQDDNMLRDVRIETVWGLSWLMEEAFFEARNLTGPTLLLYGEKDEVIPLGPTARMLKSLPEAARVQRTTALYPEGYHLLGRDLQAETVWQDITAWIRRTPLPSGFGENAEERLLKLAD